MLQGLDRDMAEFLGQPEGSWDWDMRKKNNEMRGRQHMLLLKKQERTAIRASLAALNFNASASAPARIADAEEPGGGSSLVSPDDTEVNVATMEIESILPVSADPEVENNDDL